MVEVKFEKKTSGDCVQFLNFFMALTLMYFKILKLLKKVVIK